jgi:predicted PurR-regulated permease PerM
MELSLLNIGLAVACGVIVAGYVAYILLPAVKSYGRIWERIAAGFLTLFVLCTLLGIGLSIGLSAVWFYDKYA